MATSNIPLRTFPLHTSNFDHSPMKNILTLLEHSVKMKYKRRHLNNKLKLLCDSDINMNEIDEIEKIEEEIDFLTKYCRTLDDQAVVIMNEHNVVGIPTLEDIEKNIPALDFESYKDGVS
jgi:hypothetical protein